MSADFSRIQAHLAQGLKAHADRDGLTGVARAVFLDRGGHAPGTACPFDVPDDPHDPWCDYPDDECDCHLRGGTPR
jgi:hypothetical protein